MNTGQIILKQLGGAGRLSAMVAANNIGYGEKHLVFHFKGIRQMNMVRIELNGWDLYDVSFFKVNKRTYDIKLVEVVEDIQAADLKEVFENKTGLLLSL